MTMTEFVSIMGLAVAVAQLAATITPGRRAILLTGGAALALLSLMTLYSVTSQRRLVDEATDAVLSMLEDEPRTYDELRQDLYEIDGVVFDAALEQARRSGQIGFRVMPVRSITGEIHDVRGYFRAFPGD